MFVLWGHKLAPTIWTSVKFVFLLDSLILKLCDCTSHADWFFPVIVVTWMYKDLFCLVTNASRWSLDWIFWEGYLPSLSINYVGISKDMGKKLPQLYHIYEDKNFLWSGFHCNRSRFGNVMTPLHFLFIFVFLCTRSFFKKSLKGVYTYHNCLNYGKVWTNSMTAFWKYFETKL